MNDALTIILSIVVSLLLGYLFGYRRAYQRGVKSGTRKAVEWVAVALAQSGFTGQQLQDVLNQIAAALNSYKESGDSARQGQQVNPPAAPSPEVSSADDHPGCGHACH